MVDSVLLWALSSVIIFTNPFASGACPVKATLIHYSCTSGQDAPEPFCGAAGDRSGGCVRALYNPTLSERGVLLCAARKPRTKDPLDFEVSTLILVYNSR